MKAIMISDKAKWCALMMNGDKTVEVRKESVGKAVQKLIDEQGFADIYVYCSKGKPFLHYGYNKYGREVLCHNEKTFGSSPLLNGKVVFKFRCYKVEEIKNNLAMRFFTESANEKELLKKSCLNSDQLFWYLAPQELKVKCCGYAIHISDLEIFDKPRGLCEFHTNVKKEPPEEILCPECGKPMEYYEYKYLTKAPQNYCYVEID